MNKTFRGKAWVFGNDVDTDVIIPARYLVTDDPVELGKHCMEGHDPQFPEKFHQGDIIVAGENFGCGSSREHAPLALLGIGCSCVIASSYARIFFRNAINVGLPILECPEAAKTINQGDEVEVNLAEGVIKNLSTGQSWNVPPLPEFLQDLMDKGGLVNWVRERLKEEEGAK